MLSKNAQDKDDVKGITLWFSFRKVKGLREFHPITTKEAKDSLYTLLERLIHERGLPLSMDEVAILDKYYVPLDATEVRLPIASLYKWAGFYFIVTDRSLVNGPDLTQAPKDLKAKKDARDITSYEELLKDPELEEEMWKSIKDIPPQGCYL